MDDEDEEFKEKEEFDHLPTSIERPVLGGGGTCPLPQGGKCGHRGLGERPLQPVGHDGRNSRRMREGELQAIKILTRVGPHQIGFRRRVGSSGSEKSSELCHGFPHPSYPMLFNILPA
jgi:hypothetical protein